MLLVNLGTPDAPTPAAVRKYLAEFLWDRRVVNVPRPIWWLVLNLFILRFRPRRVAKLYQSIWTEQGSPLLAIAKRQQAKLQALMPATPIQLAMTYGNPSIKQGLAALRARGVDKVLVLPLYPQFSSSTTAAIFDRVASELNRDFNLPELRYLKQYHDDSGYIDALAQSVENYWAANGRGDKLLMSFHGIPQEYEQRGDPYPAQCRTTAKRLADRLGLNDEQWLCSFQSRFGPAEWLQPYTDKTLQAWGEQGLGRVDVICPAFTADCLETLEEIAQENQAIFKDAGGRDYHYIPCLNDTDAFIETLKRLVETHSAGW